MQLVNIKVDSLLIEVLQLYPVVFVKFTEFVFEEVELNLKQQNNPHSFRVIVERAVMQLRISILQPETTINLISQWHREEVYCTTLQQQYCKMQRERERESCSYAVCIMIQLQVPWTGHPQAGCNCLFEEELNVVTVKVVECKKNEMRK